MLKTAALNVETKRLRVSERTFFRKRPETSLDECQHADIAERCFDKGLEKYSVPYFLKRGVKAKRRDGRGKFRSPLQRLAGA
jgi:hypothetical protein